MKHYPTPARPTLLRRAGRAPHATDGAHEDQSYVIEVVCTDLNGTPVGGVELSIINNNTGLQSSRYTDGNGYCNHGLVGREEDLCTLTTSGAKIAARTFQPSIGAQYLYLPAAPHVTTHISLETF